MERLFLGFAAFFGMFFGMFYEGRDVGSVGQTKSVTQYGKALLESD